VGLLNSLRIVGHEEELVFVDAGLRPDQRRRLAEHATVVTSSAALPPYVLKLSPSSTPAADARVLLDADILVLRPLTQLVGLAQEGKLVAFADPVAERSYEEWSILLGLPPIRRQTYVNAGVLAVGEELGRRLLPIVVEKTRALDIARSQHGRGSVEEPFFYYDQDVLNAVLASEAPPQGLVVLPHRLAPHPPFPGLQLVDPKALRCRYPDGTEPLVLHHVLKKPWLALTRRSL
jgi:lipopolysaccharide biosynthesis glycosyltransferase